MSVLGFGCEAQNGAYCLEGSVTCDKILKNRCQRIQRVSTGRLSNFEWLPKLLTKLKK